MQKSSSSRTVRFKVVDSETGSVVVVGGALLLNDCEAIVTERLDVPVREAERLQSVVAWVELVRVHDEGWVKLELRQVDRVVFRFNAEVGAIKADVPVDTVGVH